MKISLVLISMVLLTFACQGTNNKSTGNITGYDLISPDSYFTLPGKLHEISGLTFIDSISFACIQDENGILYIYDLIKNQIKHEFIFSGNGDYEDIARVDSTIYVLRSDGVLFEISDFRSKNYALAVYKTGIPCKENEGLCLDSRNNRLLISCKGETFTKNLKNKIVIYSFDLKTKQLSAKPAFIFDLKKVRKFVSDNKIEHSKKNNRNKLEITFKISAMCIHPLTGELYLLSAIDYMLYVVDKNGVVGNIESLDRKFFNQAEGLTFFPNGDMLITNEGGGKKPTLLRFNYKSGR